MQNCGTNALVTLAKINYTGFPFMQRVFQKVFVLSTTPFTTVKHVRMLDHNDWMLEPQLTQLH
jgi:hypothetical protein